MWMVRAGPGAFLKEDFKKYNLVAIGWNLGDLTNKSFEEIRQLYYKKYKNYKSVKLVYKFVNDIKVGDYVITSLTWDNHSYLLGKITSDYYRSEKITKTDNNNDNYFDVRDVEWIDEIIKFDLKKSTRKHLGLVSTVYEINEDAKVDILKNVSKKPPIINFKRNIIYFGAPGTGKSYNLNQDKNILLENYEENYERITFHPDFSYANFVGTYKPVPIGDSITYKYVPGPFMRILKKAINNPSEPYLLIIEEINRANVAAVFGEVFQLLDRQDFESLYPIDATEDMKTYLNKSKIRIPQNMFIWATMNSADQGVFPMDTAFKRRWDFKYFSINNNDDLIRDTKVTLNNVEINWNDLRKAINDELLSYKINEDKLIGPFFAFNEYHNQEIPEDIFKDIFKNKIIMYLFEDAAKSKRNQLFSGVDKAKNITYFQVCDEFDKNGIEIFTDSIKENFITDDGE